MAMVNKQVRNKWFFRSAALVALIAIAIVSVAVVTNGNASAGGQRPFKGNASGVFSADGTGGTGTINATHVGNGSVVFTGLSLDTTAVPNPVNGALCFPINAGGVQTFTAANGDELEMDYTSGNFCIDPVTQFPVFGDFVNTVTGGTGRFEGATGEILIDAVAPVPFDGTWSSEFLDGSWISY